MISQNPYYSQKSGERSHSGKRGNRSLSGLYLADRWVCDRHPLYEVAYLSALLCAGATFLHIVPCFFDTWPAAGLRMMRESPSDARAFIRAIRAFYN